MIDTSTNASYTPDRAGSSGIYFAPQTPNYSSLCWNQKIHYTVAHESFGLELDALQPHRIALLGLLDWALGAQPEFNPREFFALSKGEQVLLPIFLRTLP